MPTDSAALPVMPVSLRYKKIIAVSLPLCISIISQSLLTLVDITMVGRISSACVAAFGMGNAIYYVFSSLLIGVSISVQAMTARREGEANIPGTGKVLNAGLILGLLFGSVFAVILVPASWSMFRFLNASPDVLAEGAPYLAARLASLPPTGINFAFYGFFNGLKRPQAYLGSLLVMHASNVFFNYTFIFGHFGMPALGTMGAGIGTLLATLMGSCFMFLLTLKKAKERKVLKILPDLDLFRNLARLVTINGMQQAFLASAIVCFLWIVGRMGVSELAIATVLMNLSLFSLLPCVTIGHSSGSFVSHALGEKRPDEARKWGNAAINTAVIYAGILAIPIIVAPKAVMGIFIIDKTILEASILPALITSAVFMIEGASTVLVYSLIGAGYSTPVLVTVLVTLWGLLIPGSYILASIPGMGLNAVWSLLMACRIIQTIVLALMWKGGKWQQTKI